MATHSSILAWEIPRTEEPGGLQSLHGVAKCRTQLKQLSPQSLTCEDTYPCTCVVILQASEFSYRISSQIWNYLVTVCILGFDKVAKLLSTVVLYINFDFHWRCVKMPYFSYPHITQYFIKSFYQVFNVHLKTCLKLTFI